MVKEESVLILDGASSVGQATITVALNMNCKVFTTINDPDQKKCLRDIFPQLGDEHIGQSCNATFEKSIMKGTNGRGVDVVVNLLGLKISQAWIGCLRNGGRFLHLKNSDAHQGGLDLSALKSNATFQNILLEEIWQSAKEVHSLLSEGMASGLLRPLPRNVFSVDDIQQALRCITSDWDATATVIKVRCQSDSTKSKTFKAVSCKHMNAQKVYIIVGGLGGYGMELADWLITRGAKKLVLTYCHSVLTSYHYLCLNRWRRNNVEVITLQLDASDPKPVDNLFREANKLGTVGGIFNLAAVIRDNTVLKLTNEQFATVVKAKVGSTTCLDNASRKLASHLDYFVVFSSMTSGRGNIGQANYCFANSAMERVIEKRHRDGLPALAIQWGGIGDVGMLAEKLNAGDRTIFGTKPMSIKASLASLDTLLNVPKPVVSCFVLTEKAPPASAQSSKGGDIVAMVGKVLGISDIASVSQSTTLLSLGLDSLMAHEIVLHLYRYYAITLSEEEVRDLTFEKIKALENNICRPNS